MAPKTARKRASRLLKQLFELQKFDFELTGPFCVETKFLLRNSKYCLMLEVAAPYNFGLVAHGARSALPKFILSQLEAQKLITTSQHQIPLTRLLAFVLEWLPLRLTKAASVPTFFHWQSPLDHRTYFVFAFIDKPPPNMPPRAYTVENLLRLRGSPAPAALAALVERDPDLGGYPFMTKTRGLMLTSRSRCDY